MLEKVKKIWEKLKNVNPKYYILAGTLIILFASGTLLYTKNEKWAEILLTIVITSFFAWIIVYANGVIYERQKNYDIKKNDYNSFKEDARWLGGYITILHGVISGEYDNNGDNKIILTKILRDTHYEFHELFYCINSFAADLNQIRNLLKPIKKLEPNKKEEESKKIIMYKEWIERKIKNIKQKEKAKVFNDELDLYEKILGVEKDDEKFKELKKFKQNKLSFLLYHFRKLHELKRRYEKCKLEGNQYDYLKEVRNYLKNKNDVDYHYPKREYSRFEHFEKYCPDKED